MNKLNSFLCNEDSNSSSGSQDSVYSNDETDAGFFQRHEENTRRNDLAYLNDCDGLSQTLRKYLRSKTQLRESDPIQFWEKSCLMSPELCNLALNSNAFLSQA